MADPKKGTGKKPKGSGRRLYTDENPRDTVRIKFATPADARATVAKVKRVNKPFARKIQILTVLEQRARVMGKMEQARLAKAAKARLKEILKETNNEFILVSYGVGKFGRCLGELFSTMDSDSINNQLVSEGHAKKYYGGKR